ncbi:hypothetical protein [Spiroplasma endosymbiont of Amphibalanus improvisus]|uniref:SLAC1 family transporter n=1 Tax=Spiroplasma endosymbiont of Amphibalanus improvisus TaxID=3066327 RepID=UPI00313B8E15
MKTTNSDDSNVKILNKDIKKISNLKEKNVFATRMHNVNLGILSFGLGILTLANTWFQYLVVTGDSDPNKIIPFQAVCAAIQLSIIVIILLKWIVDFKTIKVALFEPTETAHLPLLWLLLVSFSTFLFQLAGSDVTGDPENKFLFMFGQILWWIGMIPQILYFGFWWYVMVKNGKFKDIDSSILIPNIGLSVGTAVPANMFANNSIYSVIIPILWLFSFLMYLLCLVLILWRHLFVQPALSEKLAPTIAIIGSGGSLLLATFYGIGVDAHNAGTDQFYDKLFGTNWTIFMIWMLFIVSTMMGFIVYMSIFKYLFAKQFNPNMNSFTFPTAISAGGTLTFAAFSGDMGYGSSLINGLKIVGLIQLCVSTLIHTHLLISNTFATGYALSVSPENYKLDNTKIKKYYLNFLKD